MKGLPRLQSGMHCDANHCRATLVPMSFVCHQMRSLIHAPKHWTSCATAACMSTRSHASQPHQNMGAIAACIAGNKTGGGAGGTAGGSGG